MTLETAVQNVGVVEALYEMAVDEGTMLSAIIFTAYSKMGEYKLRP